MPKITIGLTGGIASGKSTVAKIFQSADIPVVDADIAAREVVEKGTKGLDEIVKFFGRSILTKTGDLNRTKLGQIIFNDEKKRIKLNRIVHPLVREWMLNEREKLFKAGYNIVLFDIPLLFESKLDSLVDEIIVVWVPKDLQLERLKKRDYLSKKEAQARINAQLSLNDKRLLADYIIDNSGNQESTTKMTQTLIQQLKKKHSH